MIYNIYYGEISSEGREVWNGAEMSPFSVLEKNMKIQFDNWLAFIGWARVNLCDEVQVDWGSFAWKCTGSDLVKMNQQYPRMKIQDYDNIQPDKEYGVVFIEMS